VSRYSNCEKKGRLWTDLPFNKHVQAYNLQKNTTTVEMNMMRDVECLSLPLVVTV